jgi:flagellar biosynthesis component FlhA
LKPAQVILSLVGLVAIVLAYRTGNPDYLLIAIAALFGGLYLMGALRRSGQQDNQKATNSKAKSAKDKNQNQR